MLRLGTTKKYQKAFALAEKRKKNIQKLEDILQLLIEEKSVPPKYKNHKLKGKFEDHWECHIEPDWLLIYLK
jgi:mRNA interferase YafQ